MGKDIYEISTFPDTTSTHGLARIKYSNGITRVLWILAFLTALGLLTFQTYKSINQYFTSNVATSIEVTRQESGIWPDITICNKNMLKASSPITTRILNVTGMMNDSTSVNQFLDFFVRESLRKQTNKSMETINLLTNAYVLVQESTTEFVQRSIFEYGKKNADVEQAMHQKDDMIIGCVISQFLCKQWIMQIKTSMNSDFGHCFTISLNSSEMLALPGPQYGVKLLLNTEMEEYLPYVSTGVGLVVELHEKNSIPFPEDLGFSISPGTESTIAISKQVIKKQSRTGSECLTEIKDYEHKSIFHWKAGFEQSNYSHKACMNECYLDTIKEQFDCIDSTSVTFDIASKGATCNFDNWDWNSGVQKNLGSNITDKCVKSKICPKECEKVKYNFDLSASPWDEQISQQFNESSSFNHGMNKLSILRLFFRQLEYQKIIEKQLMSSWGLLANIGGTCGLYMGISLLTACEYLELFANVVRRK